MQRFTAWLQQVGVTAPKLVLDTPLATGRRGLFATSGISADEFIASVPREALLTSEQAPLAATAQLHRLPAFGALERGSVELALALCSERLAAEGSAWSPWIDMLPRRVPGWLTVQREEAEAMLAGPRLEAHLNETWLEIERAREGYESIYEACGIRKSVATLYGHYNPLCASAGDSLPTQLPAVREEELFAWALSIVCSRGQTMGDGPDAACGMYPFLDMINCPDDLYRGGPNAEHFNLPVPHTPQERAMRDDWYRQAGVVEPQGLAQERILLQALRPIQAGQELHESCYVGKSELELLFYFGFVPGGSHGGDDAGRERSARMDRGLFLERQRQLNTYYSEIHS